MALKKVNRVMIFLSIFAVLLQSSILIDKLIEHNKTATISEDIDFTKNPNPTKQKPTPTVTPITTPVETPTL